MSHKETSECEHALRLRREFAAVRFRYIMTELDLAITECESAANTPDVCVKDRMLAHARNFYEAAEHAKEQGELTKTMRTKIELRELRLNSLLVIARLPLN